MAVSACDRYTQLTPLSTWNYDLGSLTASEQTIMERKRVQHLFNRLSFGASKEDMSWALSQTPEQVVDAILNAALSVAIPDHTVFKWAHVPECRDPFQCYGVSWERGNTIFREWMVGLIGQNDPNANAPTAIADRAKSFKYKLVMFWHNHFVVQSGVVEQSNFMYLYYHLLHKNALGNFKDFVKEMGLTPAMLYFLNGHDNERDYPNENYARELFELFTLGVDNGYTQADIDEATRVLTGWKAEIWDVEPTIDINHHILDPDAHDWTAKTVFGQTVPGVLSPAQETQAQAMQEYDLLHDILFAQRSNEIAGYICGKIYKQFVYNKIDSDGQNIIDQMAASFQTNWSIIEALRVLLKSQHFFSTVFMGANIKSPLECMLSMYRMTSLQYGVDYFPNYVWLHYPTLANSNCNPADYPLEQWYPDYCDTIHPSTPSDLLYDRNANPYGYVIDDPNTGVTIDYDYTNQGMEFLRWACNVLGQEVFNPINVAGWPGHRTWINEFTLTQRWGMVNNSLWGLYDDRLNTFEKIRQLMGDLYNRYTGENRTLAQINDPELVTRAIIDHFFVVEFSAEIIKTATQVFKSDRPENYYTNGWWDLTFDDTYFVVPQQFMALMRYLSTLPEYQLV